MQTNCLLQQNALAGQNPVSSYCLMPLLRFALLFIFIWFYFFFHLTAAPYWNKQETTSQSGSAERPQQVFQSISVFRQRCQESFFSFWRIWSPLQKVLSCFYHSAIQGSLTFFFFFYVQQHLETLDRLVFSFGKDHRRKADFKSLKTDAHRVGCGIAK